jgi:protein-S-isoprenylcysteine O-methyltransferase Ste14
MKTVRNAFEKYPERMIWITLTMVVMVVLLVGMWIIPLHVVSAVLATFMVVVNVLVTAAVLGFSVWTFRTMGSDD